MRAERTAERRRHASAEDARGLRCPQCGLLAEGVRCPRCNALLLASCTGECRSCASRCR